MSINFNYDVFSNFNFDLGSIIDIFGIVINGFLAYWIVYTIQKKVDNSRYLKEHFTNELLDIRNSYREFLDSLYSGSIRPSEVTPLFKLMNVKIINLMSIVFEQYKIPLDTFNPFQNELRDLVTNNAEFIAQYNQNQPLVFTDNFKTQLITFQQDNLHLFNDAIVKINNY